MPSITIIVEDPDSVDSDLVEQSTPPDNNPTDHFGLGESSTLLENDEEDTMSDSVPEVLAVVPKKYYKPGGYGEGQMSVEDGKAIEYEISFSNEDADPALVVITDTMSKGLVYTPNSAIFSGGELEYTEEITVNSDQSTTVVWTITDLAQGNYILHYNATVNSYTKPADGPWTPIQTVSNSAVITYNGTNKYNLSKLQNPVPSKDYGHDVWMPVPMLVAPEETTGQIVHYMITYKNLTKETQYVSISDTTKVLSGSGTFTYVPNSALMSGSNASEPVSIINNPDGGQTLVWDVGEVAPNGSVVLTYTTILSAPGEYSNEATLTEGENQVQLKPIIREVGGKEYADDTQLGEIKEVGSVIVYQINYDNPYQDQLDIMITDTLSKGLEYQPGSAKVNGESVEETSITKNNDGSTTVIWDFPWVSTGNYSLTYSAVVTPEATEIGVVKNNASISHDHESKLDLGELFNMVPRKYYSDSQQSSQTIAELGTVFSYGIQYANGSSEKADITIVDTMSKGLTYVENSANLTPTAVVVEEQTGETMITWELKEVDPHTTNTIFYQAQVNEDINQVPSITNSVKIKYNDRPFVDLEDLINYPEHSEQPDILEPTQPQEPKTPPEQDHSFSDENEKVDTGWPAPSSKSPNNPVNKEDSAKEENSSTPTPNQNPNTGDTNQLNTWVLILGASIILISALGIGLILHKLFKKRNHERFK